jgi:hypothetical protein
VKFFFLSTGTRRLDLAVRGVLGINKSLLGLQRLALLPLVPAGTLAARPQEQITDSTHPRVFHLWREKSSKYPHPLKGNEIIRSPDGAWT